MDVVVVLCSFWETVDMYWQALGKQLFPDNQNFQGLSSTIVTVVWDSQTLSQWTSCEVVDWVSSSTIPYKTAEKVHSVLFTWIQNGTSFIYLFSRFEVIVNSEVGGWVWVCVCVCVGGGGVSKTKFVQKSMNLNWNVKRKGGSNQKPFLHPRRKKRA